MPNPEVKVVVKLEVEQQVDSYSSIFICGQWTILGPVVHRSIRESVFDDPESVTEVHGGSRTNP